MHVRAKSRRDESPLDNTKSATLDLEMVPRTKFKTYMLHTQLVGKQKEE